MTTDRTARQLGDLGKVVRGVSYNPATDLMASRTAEAVDLLRANNVQDGSIVLDEVQHVHRRRVRPDQILRAGDVLICAANGSKRLVGKSAQVRPGFGAGDTFGAFMMTYRPDSRLVDPGFVAHVFQTRKYRDWVELLLAGSSINNLRPSAITEYSVGVPCRSEQRRIASVLAEADEMIDAIERFIAKKRAIKQGMMQELLTGRSRLPGFNDQWSDVRLGELGTFLKGRGIKRDQVRPTGVPCIRYGELYTAYSDYTETTLSFVEPAAAAMALPIRKGDVLFAGSGETKEEIGMSVAYIGDKAAVAGGDIVVLRGSGYDPAFLASLLNSPRVALQKARGGQGDAVVHINSRVLAAIGLRVPQPAEQQAIASVIRDVDAETSALARRLEAARNVKQGMMQELLTGRTRLGVEGDAA